PRSGVNSPGSEEGSKLLSLEGSKIVSLDTVFSGQQITHARTMTAVKVRIAEVVSRCRCRRALVMFGEQTAGLFEVAMGRLILSRR
ncbi:MAG TPA: hypothetical protein VH877_25730, partial [Polyangia bacterium]|nr:hypothetical protein [Polyangia bacterium]